MKNPVIDIKYGRFLSPYFNYYAEHSQEKGEPDKPAELEVVLERIEKQKEEWVPIESSVLTGIQETLELEYQENYIPVYIVPLISTAFSDPIVISSLSRTFADVLSHELIHRLITNNTRDIDFRKILVELFPEFSKNISLRNHILVHAVHKHIYLNILQDKNRLEKDIAFCQEFEVYREAWKIVEERGYKEILENIKSKY